MGITPPYYPIIYVHGYDAWKQSKIEENLSPSHVELEWDPVYYVEIEQGRRHGAVGLVFGLPSRRLLAEEGYIGPFTNGDLKRSHKGIPARSIWFFHYYDDAFYEPDGAVSEALEKKLFTIPEFAAGLREFLLRVRDRVCGDDARDRYQFRVYLVAHSMGGLICRSYLQKLCRKGTGDSQRDQDLELPGDPLVEKAFTYATPHNGIEFHGITVPDLGSWDAWHVRNFNREVMRDYLDLPPESHRVDNLNGTFPRERFFCLAGSNYKDYRAYRGLFSRVTGPMSDGLVMIRNATVQGAPHACVHRSHSDIVESEEGYQNLRRFLFGSFHLDASLEVGEVTLPEQVQALKDAGKEVRALYYIGSLARVWGTPCILHERRAENHSAIAKGHDQLIENPEPIQLFTGFLEQRDKIRWHTEWVLAFELYVAIQVPVYEVEREYWFWFDSSYKGGHLFEETFTFHIWPQEDGIAVTYGLTTEDGIGEANRREGSQALDLTSGGGTQIGIPVSSPVGTHSSVGPNLRGTLLLVVQPWNHPWGQVTSRERRSSSSYRPEYT